MGKVFGCVLLAFCFLAMADAAKSSKVKGKTTDDTSATDGGARQLEEATAMMEKLQGLIDAVKENGGLCNCTGHTCECCLKINVQLILAKLCFALLFEPEAGTATLSVTISGHTVYTKTFKVSKDIPPQCFKYMMAEVCLDFYDFEMDKKGAGGCARITVKIFGKKFAIQVGCFHIDFVGGSGRKIHQSLK